MNTNANVDNLLHQISISKYDEFCLRFKKEISGKSDSDLDIFKDKIICELTAKLSSELFFEEISSIRLLLNDNKIGIAALDVPQTSTLDKATNTVYGTAAVLGIFNNIGKSSINSVNHVPFTLHTAYHSNVERLGSAGLNTPDVKLGFHNDGLLSSGKIEIPKHIVTYNLYISYRRPGNFIWVPTALWDESEKYGSIAKSENIIVKVKLTPIYYFDKNGGIINKGVDYVKTPISNINENGQRRFFLNGQVLQEDNLEKHVNFVQEIRDSLKNNSVKMTIPQKENRAIYLSNINGFHARDIFEDPIEDVDLTRVMLRSVDLNAETYPSYKQDEVS